MSRSSSSREAKADLWADPKFLETAELEDLELMGLPPFAAEVLDAIPMQIYVKYRRATFDPETEEYTGRKYLFMNRTARRILGWTVEEARAASDSDAFVGGTKSKEWKAMFKGENLTLQEGVHRRTLRNWTAETPEGKVWRLNRVDEFPVFKRGEPDEAVALCALAQDIEFQAFADSHAELRAVMLHEYGNTSRVARASLELAEWRLDSLIETIEPQEDLAGKLHQVQEYVREARGELESASFAARAMFEAMALVDDIKEYREVGAVASRIGEVFQSAPFTLMIRVKGSAERRLVYKPSVLTGVIVELVRNARKHSDRPVEGAVKVVLEIYEQGSDICWEVVNSCKRLRDRLVLSKFERSQHARGEKMGGLVIGGLLSRAFGDESLGQMFSFSDSPDTQGLVRAVLRTPEVEGDGEA